MEQFQLFCPYMIMVPLLKLAEELLFAVRQKLPTEELTHNLAQVDIGNLKSDLSDDKQRLTFWINIYNAYFQILRKEGGLKRPKIYTSPAIKLAGKSWSLDDIEHGILRRFRFKYSLGYFADIFVPQRIRENAVQTLDYRIHFALNCGAVSCPPISYYSTDDLDNQLDKATKNFLSTETQVDEAKKQVFVSRILFWFMKDFGGMAGIRNLLEEAFEMSFKDYKIRFQQYSWVEKLDNFV